MMWGFQVRSLRVSTSHSGSNGDTLPPVLGEVYIEGDDLFFEPSFPFSAGITYYVSVSKAAVDPELFGLMHGGEMIQYSVLIPKMEREPVASVAAVYPSRNELPENLLKFLHPLFSSHECR